MDTIDFRPATDLVAALVRGVRDDQLGAPTPCPAYTVGDLLDHVHGLALAFTWAATKSAPPGGASPSADAAALPGDWRDAIPARLTALAAAWEDPDAYAGLTMAGPIEMPAEIAALVALDEVVVHGWDLARATGQAYDPHESVVRASLDFARGFEVPEGAGDGPFGPAVPVEEDAALLDRLAGATGREPGWAPAS
ncbi:TIGR03086 family metal-binding protein [Nocardioides mangrovi]|uniref:TIGR03086 family protein n=1 Tax=Nocardioides mangrovi TaxID=2874580 RepID=A0ABS7UE78_9ACTN|nr:TIGR03086 family metal-binding protein [Nocardioides mangrovi]MBZ5739011.1 TIGR03086 family protein [Nocardioides mangrovi]